MMHDLYTIPWQNNNNIKKSKLVLRHGFAHPLEAAINSMVWFKKEFNNAMAEKVTPNCRAKCAGCGAAKFGCGVCFETKGVCV